MSLVAIEPPAYDLSVTMAYAGADNFTGAPIYARAACYLHTDAAACLERAIVAAGQLGLRLLVFDAFRPVEAQWALWSHTPDPDFLADPRHGSPHSRGVAIDLTLLDGAGRALEMGTPFDYFSPLSHHGAHGIPDTARHNRMLLLGLMTEAGWDFYRNEWWHYQLFDSRRYPLLHDRGAGTRLMAQRT
ncbi:MAG TPA: D-alanyl-D-alanine dipeptidase [Alphaproteobacteria bacterium]|jgi:D-alanyl-D-alanine dipeptidase|nr:D-alanyl-D-alanine dipeptidase [Alphaproteobacteria bacterium]